MAGRGWWIAAAGVVLAFALWGLFATRGPAPGRAPASRGGPGGGPSDTGRPPGGSVRLTIAALPPGSQPAWTLEARDSAGQLHEEKGTGERECVLRSLALGRLRCILRAEGFVGESLRVESEDEQEVAATLTLRRLGRVSGVVRCEGVPVAGVLVHLTVPIESAAALMDLSPADRRAGAARSVESDANGRYSFDRVLPVQGLTLVAAGFDHAPVRAGPLDVRPGEDTTADFALVAGAHLSGRIVDLRGAPCGGATVNILRRHDKRAAVIWDDEARARTDEDGRFVTPALSGQAVRMLKAWIVIDGIQLVIQHETSPPERGTKDVGTLAPHPGSVLFEVEGGVAAHPSAVLTVAVNADPPGVGPSFILSDATFDRDGRVRIAGLPAGEGVYAVVCRDTRAVSEGKFRTTGSDIVVKVPPLQVREELPAPEEQLIVDVTGTEEPALLVLIADSQFVMWREIGKGSLEPVVERVSPGRYTLFLRAGDRYGQREITQVAGQDLRTSIAPDRIGRSVSVLVLDEGKPVPGATVHVRGFGKGSGGLRAPWAKAGDDGRVVLRGLPPDVVALTIAAMAADHGRGYSLDFRDTDEVTVDLAVTPDGD